MSSPTGTFKSPLQEEDRPTGKIDLLGMTLYQMQDLCAAEGFPRYTADQLCKWLYGKRVEQVGEMTNLSKAQRERLSQVAYIGRRAAVNCQQSVDGTKKYLFPVADGHYVEAVYIPEAERATLCVSCQMGCKMGCKFCVTGRQGFHGNLTAGEILNQLFSIPEADSLTNVVFMGMGEPMDNLDAVLAATQVMTSDWGMGWSPKRITVSSVGLLPGLRRFLDESDCHLAISLHSPIATERQELMPVQRAYPLDEVLALLHQYDWRGQRRLSFEYIMFRDLNDSVDHAKRLSAKLRDLKCRVNLIRFHESPEAPFRTSSPAAIAAFQECLTKQGILCTLRASRGQDIDAACGLLAGKA